jgi:lysine/ornithine N-monooxygenase
MATLENIIVGAGPYGLSIAAHLRAANINHAVVGRPMESWRRFMPACMALKSECFASNLSDPERRYTLEQFCAARGMAYARTGVPLAIADFVDYAHWFQRQAGPEIWDTTLRDLRWNGGAFELTLDDRRVTAKRVMLATGHMAFRYVPDVLMAAAPEARVRITHSADHRDFAEFSGRDITVIGRGQSGLETAALLHEQGANVRLLARAPAVDWNPDLDEQHSLFERLRRPESGLGPGWRSLFYSELPRAFFMLPRARRQHVLATAHAPAGAWWLKRRVVGKVPLLTSHEVVAAEARGDKLDLTMRSDRGALRIATDHVIAATGYRVDLDRLTFLEPSLRAAIKTADGAPVLNPVFESSVPGLHFVGLSSALSFGPVMRFVYGSRHAAAILTAHMRATARSRSKSVSTALGARSAAR